MQLTRISRLALLATVYIAQHEKKGFISSKEIARKAGTSAPYLVRILRWLDRNGVLVGEAGRHGGFALAKPAGKITLLEIVEAIDGPLRLDPVSMRSLKAFRHASRKLEATYKDILEGTRSRLGKITIKQLMG